MTRTASITPLTPLAPLALALMLTGCLDLGLEGNVPLEVAVDWPPSDLVAAVHARGDAQPRGMIVDGVLWVPFGLPWATDADALRPVGAADGRTVYAQSWDDAPFDRLFTPIDPAAERPAPVEPGADTATEAVTDTAALPAALSGRLAGVSGGGVARGAAGMWQAWAPVLGRTGALPASEAPAAEAPAAEH